MTFLHIEWIDADDNNGVIIMIVTIKFLLLWSLLQVFSGAEHQACPVGFPGTVKHALSPKIKTTDFLCEKDSDCPNGKCCGILGGNMCIYLHGKDIVGNAMLKIQWYASQTNIITVFKTIFKIHLMYF